MLAHSPSRRRSRQAGFTLIELLMVVGILLVIATATLLLINTAFDADRGASGSRILQSALAGARDRAIHSTKSPLGARNMGIRFLIANQTEGTVLTLQRVEETQPWSTGSLVIDDLDPSLYTHPISVQRKWGPPPPGATPDEAKEYRIPQVAYGTGTNWRNLFTRRQLPAITEIDLPLGSYVVDTVFVFNDVRFNGMEMLVLTVDYTTTVPTTPIDDYKLHLDPAVAPNQEGIPLPRNIAIDTRRSGLPAELVSQISLYDRFDIMYSPTGTIADSLQSQGFVHLLLRDTEDIYMQRSISEAQREQFLVTVFCATGNVDTFGVKTDDTDGDGRADDPFSFALGD